MIHPIFNIDTAKCTSRVRKVLHDAVALASKFRTEFITPEHVIYSIMAQEEFVAFSVDNDIDFVTMTSNLLDYITSIDSVPQDESYFCMRSKQLTKMMEIIKAENDELNSGLTDLIRINVSDLFASALQLEDSKAASIVEQYIENSSPDWDSNLLDYYADDLLDYNYDDIVEENEGKERDAELSVLEQDALPVDMPEIHAEAYVNGKKIDLTGDELYAKMMQSAGRLMGALNALGGRPGGARPQDPQMPKKEPWEEMVTCINETYKKKNPLIGRQKELNRTIRILCRKDKNNPLFIGESGVGKTALIYGLTRMIVEDEVPEWLKNQTVYAIDMASIVAGASFHGEFEKRMKMILDGAQKKGNCILYIDEIHSIMGNGGQNNAMNAADMMKPYLEDGSIRFIGTTTYQDYNKSMANNKAIVRRFGQIDIKEPSVDETIEIITELLPVYEKHHGVKYDKEAVAYAVRQSHALITDRFLPDKAIDIIDEAGAYLQQNPLLNKEGKPKAARYQKVDASIIKTILTDVCRISAKALTSESNESLKNLDERIGKEIYGQDDAVRNVVRSVMMAKAGLMDPEKPLASLLFVGPTGVGKTELCRVLAKELGVELLRFDMSEYTEKHTISKLIGSPAGYVGYDEGGLLTDAIRKTPNCVLLLDEIEKAHSDIYNILLQVMDYARLTDNKGNKADFKNVILVMTSNAGAQYAGQASVGFTGGLTKGQAMLQTVKKTFKPEFLNRLSGTVVFNEMDRTMASLILTKKLHQIEERLKAKNVTLNINDSAREFLLDKGFTSQYGAREMDRVLQQYLTPLLMEEILFGRLKKGGTANVALDDLSQSLTYVG